MGDALLYLTSLGVTLSGVFSFYSVVESNIVRIPSLIFILNGHLISYLLREHKNRRLYSAFFTVSLLLLLIIDAFKGNGLLLFPPEIGGEPGLTVGNFLLWLVVLRSFTLFSTPYLLFSIVPSVAFLGLISAYSVDPELFVYASLCFLFSILLLLFSTYDLSKLLSLRSSLFLLGLELFLISAILALILLFPLRSLSLAVPTPQVYVRFGNLFRQELLSNSPFLPNALPLGGGLPRGDDVIMAVKGEGPLLLRAGTYDYFSGRYWVKTFVNFTFIRGEKGKFTILPPNPSYPRERFEIYPKSETLFALPPSGFPGPLFFMGRRVNLLTPPHPCEIRFTSEVVPSYLLKGIDNTLSGVFFRTGDISYEVVAQSDIPWQETYISSIYLQRPPSPKTNELAKRLTAPYKDDYQKALTIQNYLKSNYTYRLSGSPPPQDNGVEWFLFKSKKGDCDFFASAMCILLREAGIPSRVAVGYSVGEYDEKNGVWLVRQRDAHMWVEAYIKGKGWMTFDPTPGGASTFQDLLLSLQRYYLLHKRDLVPLTLFLLSLLLLLFLFRLSWREVMEKGKAKRTTREMLVISYLSLCRRLEKMGFPPRKGYNTLREWFQMVAPLLSPQFLASLKELTQICEEACYGNAVDEEKMRIALEKIRELRREKKWQIVKTSTS